MAPLRIAVVTGNDDKWAEISSIMTGVDLIRMKADLPELQGATVADVALEKCIAAAKLVDHTHADFVVIEDTGLCFDALGGRLPGPYIKWFVKDLGPSGIARILDGYNTREATAVCVYAMCPCKPHGVEVSRNDIRIFEGAVRGLITTAPRTRCSTFGWDPIFQPRDQLHYIDNQHTMPLLTYGEMDPSVKNSLSHRKKALDMLSSYLLSLNR